MPLRSEFEERRPRTPRKRLLIIHNAIAGMRRRWLLRHVCRELESAGARIDVVSADSFEADRMLAEKAVASGDWDAVVAAGGDSTVRGVGAGLAGSELPLGIIPVGTGNVLAHEIRFRSGPRTIAYNLMHGPSIPFFGGRANGACFFAMAGAGFDARVLARLDVGLKRRLGKLAYALPLVREHLKKPELFEAEIDGELHRCSWLIVAKASRYAGPFVLSRERTIRTDGFHAVIVRAARRTSLLGVALAIALGRAESHPDVTVMPCRRVVIHGEPRVLVELDGEVFGPSPIEITPADEPLRIIVPA
jgi:diacylglycerol kinase family enzyme